MTVKPHGPYQVFELEVTSTTQQSCYLDFRCDFSQGEVVSYSGIQSSLKIFRQSPHDPDDHVLNMDKEAIPLAAVIDQGVCWAIISDNPAHCDNYTTQTLDPDQHRVMVSSGDPGGSPGHNGLTFQPYFHQIGPRKTHRFRVVTLSFPWKDLVNFRQRVQACIGKVWGQETSQYYALCFATNYMHYRKNETGYSEAWVVPGIEYGNKQYTRDAFWQTLILPMEMEQQCYDAVYPDRYKYAETPLIFLIWSYRLQKRGGRADPVRMKDALAFVEDHVVHGVYLAVSGHNKPDYRSWYDVCSFEEDDVISYNQGLLVVALEAVHRLGLKTSMLTDDALRVYRDLFLADKGYYPLSRKKPQVLCLDVFVGDVLSQILFNTPLLPTDQVLQHYEWACQVASTPHGIKVTSQSNGEFLPLESYGVDGYINEGFAQHKPGQYQWGGSWYLYEALFHIAGHLHGAAQAEERLFRRLEIDWLRGGTYFEYVDTVTSVPTKANQGWNAAVYPLWAQLMAEGRASGAYFERVEKLM